MYRRRGPATTGDLALHEEIIWITGRESFEGTVHDFAVGKRHVPLRGGNAFRGRHIVPVKNEILKEESVTRTGRNHRDTGRGLNRCSPPVPVRGRVPANAV